jgi:site-specific DNA-methyltransferase (cytosine-N4-specific)
VVSLPLTETHHEVFFRDSRDMGCLEDMSIQLVVTSPPYPMIEMWDPLFEHMNGRIARLMSEIASSEEDASLQAASAYELMHKQLAKVWRECYRVLCQGGIACINIGDATRTLNGRFRLYANHAKVIEHCERIGFVTLPFIVWKKPTNKPNAFLGSGFLPTNGYVTQDFEHILIFRKGDTRRFPPKDAVRYSSSFTKAQRDVWFSQAWSVHGAAQSLGKTQRRSAAFPEEIPRRLIQMFSLIGDTVLDPFLGTGTTAKVAGELSRNSVGFEFDTALRATIYEKLGSPTLDLLDRVEFTRAS